MSDKIFEIKTDKYFDSYRGDDVIRCLLEQGYVLTITPVKYSGVVGSNEDKYSMMIEIGDIDDSFE